MRNKGMTGSYKRVYFCFLFLFFFYKNRTVGKDKISSYTT